MACMYLRTWDACKVYIGSELVGGAVDSRSWLRSVS
jgi:hypothetical protein